MDRLGLKALLSRLLDEEEGNGELEYALSVLLIVLAVVAAVAAIGAQLTD